MLVLFALASLPFLAVSKITRDQFEIQARVLVGRNPCDGLNYSHITLYEDYSEPLCPAPKHLDAQGECEDYANAEQDCASFCQLTTTYIWGRESPFFKSECHYPMRCELRETDSTMWTLEGYIAGDVQFRKALEAGITGGVGSSSGHAKDHSWSITPLLGECGYFTWVPITKRTCGTLTSSLKVGTSEDGWTCLNKTTTVQDICHDQVWYLEGGPDGVVRDHDPRTFRIHFTNKKTTPQVIWVRTNCSTGEPLGFQSQDPVYNSPEVSLYAYSSSTMFDGWSTNTCVMTNIKSVSDGTWFNLEIQARGLQLGMVGNNGEVLFRRVNACGDISSWNFTWADVAYPNSTWDMAANSTLFVKKGVSKACIGTALEQAGGVADNCV
ncbi:hypothetical protein J7T55_009010 [Diaporthe amygdali]|uniref:uncharacterized protein n=1 Tax=Phomopsis amygdali TaxID=1214568 RepID=UPI0022FDDC8A|nr:uncharacterized protein J7T55_009010 [Diaporthe amygdali]KAJ0118227.1 hypothetical protein J7T55_009010 [Diaporthe amygdali]